jgi:hypothetical protein
LKTNSGGPTASSGKRARLYGSLIRPRSSGKRTRLYGSPATKRKLETLSGGPAAKFRLAYAALLFAYSAGPVATLRKAYAAVRFARNKT